MNLDQILEQSRSCYLRQFSEAFTKVTADGQPATIEAAFRNENGELSKVGAMSLPWRGDIFVIREGQPPECVSVDSEVWLAFEPFSIELGDNVTAEMAPFYWDGCNISTFGILEQTDWSYLKTWFTKWFDVEDLGNADAEGFLGVIHFLSDPKFDGSKTEFQVDFGSAPVAAFRELLDALKASGAATIQVGITPPLVG